MLWELMLSAAVMYSWGMIPVPVERVAGADAGNLQYGRFIDSIEPVLPPYVWIKDGFVNDE